jgi:Ca2+-binding RTX toxin-like protein
MPVAPAFLPHPQISGQFMALNLITLNGTAFGDALNAQSLVVYNSSTLAIGRTYHFIINGNDGNDVINGGEYNSQLNGGNGNDTITGNTNAWNSSETIHGDAGDDVLDAGDGDAAQYVYGDDGNDVLIGNSVNFLVVLDGGNGNDTITALGRADVIGGLGDDSINVTGGSAGTVTVNGGDGNDTVYIENGNNLQGGNVLGGAGNDEIVFGTYLPGMKGTFQGVAQGFERIALTGYITADRGSFNGGGGDDYYDFSGLTARLIGAGAPRITLDDNYSQGNDFFIGSSLAEIVYGLNGTDTINGGGGNDTLYAGGSVGCTLIGGSGNDLLYGGDGSDVLYVTELGDLALGGYGNDLVWTTVNHTLASLTYEGGISEDLRGVTGSGALFLTGNYVANVIVGVEGNDTIVGLGGNDAVYGQGGNDFLDGGDANDTVSGGDGNDIVILGEGDDWGYADANAGSDYLYGGNGNDNLVGGTGGIDVLLGQGDNDILSDASGSYTYLYGGTGLNTMTSTAAINVFNSEGSADTMNGGNASFYYRLAAGSSLTNGGAGVDQFVGGSAASNDTFFGGANNDYGYGGNGDDYLSGGLGNDVLLGQAGNDTLEGGAGVNLLWASDVGNDQVRVNIADGGTQVLEFFEAGGANDVVRLLGSSLTSFAGIQNLVANLGVTQGANLMVNAGSGAQLYLNLGANQTAIWFQGVSAYSLTSADFLFG